jgi:hypothetical protein
MRAVPLTDRQRIVKLFVVWTLGLAVLFGSPAVSLAGGFQALSPPPGLSFEKTQPVDFSWSPELYAVRYRLEVTDKNGQEVVSALLQQGTTGYRAALALRESARRAPAVARPRGERERRGGAFDGMARAHGQEMKDRCPQTRFTKKGGRTMPLLVYD